MRSEIEAKLPSHKAPPQKANGNAEILISKPLLPFKLTESNVFLDGTKLLTTFGSTIQSIFFRQNMLSDEEGLAVNGHKKKDEGEIFTRGLNNGKNGQNAVGMTDERRKQIDIEITQICESMGILRQSGTISELARQFNLVVQKRNNSK